jgi:hypothetical protein
MGSSGAALAFVKSPVTDKSFPFSVRLIGLLKSSLDGSGRLVLVTAGVILGV